MRRALSTRSPRFTALGIGLLVCLVLGLFGQAESSRSEFQFSGLSLAQTHTANPHSKWIFGVTGTRSCADCHYMSKAGTDELPVLDNEAVRSLIARGKGAHRGRFADCFRCHPGGRQRG